MKMHVYPIAILFILFGIVACNNNEQESLDQEYLESRRYKTFQDEASEEKKYNEKLNKALEWHLQQFTDCEVSHLSIPFKLNYEKIGGLIMEASEDCIVESRAQRLKLLGKTVKQNQTVKWVLLERETAYRDQDILAVTFQDNELRSFKTVGVFRKNPSEKISTEIQTRYQADEIQIISRTTRSIFYPIEQDNRITTEYVISASGNIREL